MIAHPPRFRVSGTHELDVSASGRPAARNDDLGVPLLESQFWRAAIPQIPLPFLSGTWKRAQWFQRIQTRTDHVSWHAETIW